MMKRFQVAGNNGGVKTNPSDIPTDIGDANLDAYQATQDEQQARGTRDALYAVHPNSENPDLEAFNRAGSLIAHFTQDKSHVLYTNDQGQPVTVERLRHAYAEVAVRLVENSHLSPAQRAEVRAQFASQSFLTENNIRNFDAKIAQANAASGANAQGGLAGLEARRGTATSTARPHAPGMNDYRAAVAALETAQNSGVALSEHQFNEAYTLSLLLQGLSQNGVYPVGSSGYRQLQALIRRTEAIVERGNIPVTSHPLPNNVPAAAEPSFAVAGAPSTVTSGPVAPPHGRAYAPVTNDALNAAMDGAAGADPVSPASPAPVEVTSPPVDMVFTQEVEPSVPEEATVTNYRQVMAGVEDVMSRMTQFRAEHPHSPINPNDVAFVNTALDSALQYLQGLEDSASLHRLDVTTPYTTIETNAGALRAEVAAMRARLQGFTGSN